MQAPPGQAGGDWGWGVQFSLEGRGGGPRLWGGRGVGLGGATLLRARRRLQLSRAQEQWGGSGRGGLGGGRQGFQKRRN